MEWNKDKTNSRRDINYLKWHFLRSEEDLKRRNFDLTSYNNCFKPHNVTYNKPFCFFKVGGGGSPIFVLFCGLSEVVNWSYMDVR